jgi:hypothetical protein
MKMGLPTPDLRKLDMYGLSGHRPFDLLVPGKEALAERGT